MANATYVILAGRQQWQLAVETDSQLRDAPLRACGDRLDAETADRDACAMEHCVSGQTQERLVKFISFSRLCARSGDTWLSSFREFCQTGRYPHLPADDADDA